MLRFGHLTATASVLLSFLWAQAAIAQEMPDPVLEEMHGRAVQFLDQVAQDQADTAYQDLLRGSPLLQQLDQSEAMKTLVEKTKELRAKYGECRKVERIAAKKIGSNVLVLGYLYQCEFFPIAWHFVFYRTPPRSDLSSPVDQPWRLITVRFDTELEKLAE